MQTQATIQAIAAAALFGLCAPLSKLLITDMPPMYMAALLYLGAGIGMLALIVLGKKRRTAEARLKQKDSLYVVLMIMLDIAAPIFLMYGISLTNPATAALLGNFEIVATAMVAMIVFKEAIGKRLWIALELIAAASAILSLEDFHTITFSLGAVFVLLSCLCWGLENNCTRMLSLRDPMQIVVVKGFGSGAGALGIAMLAGQITLLPLHICGALLLGFFAYGLSIYYYVTAQRVLGAARTGAYYAFAPFIGVLLSVVLFENIVTASFIAAAGIMLVGTWFVISENHSHLHLHERLVHEHRHNHTDSHHTHTHEQPVIGEHNHIHIHEPVVHAHGHTPDLHHRHTHEA